MGNGNDWFASAPLAFLLGMGVYVLLLAFIFLQNKFFKKALRKYRNILLFTVNLDLLAFLGFYHFILAGHRVFPNSSALIALFSLVLYFLGLFVYHISAYDNIPAGTRGLIRSSRDYGWMQLRLLFPFTIPFLLFSLILDLAKFVPSSNLQQVLLYQEDSLLGVLVLLIFSALFLFMMMIFFPPLLQWMWKCKPLNKGVLLERLEEICRRGNFKHAGMKTWTVMNHAFTAGIIGVLPKYRYVMFTKRLLDEMPPECVEAILAHEIGHSYRKHLLIYPFVLLGMIITTGLFSLFFSRSIDDFFSLHYLLDPSPAWKALYPLIIFVPYAIIMGLYFRFVFGYFSRLFERQADLHVFELHVPPEDMQRALDSLGTLTGNTHLQPCWHHYGIQARIDFLGKAIANPSVIAKHHRRVKRNLFVYFNLLAFGCILLISPFLSDLPPFKQLAEFSAKTSQSVSDLFSADLQHRLATEYIEQYRLKGNREKIESALTDSIKKYAASMPEGIVEYAAAKTLFEEGELPAGAKLMSVTWRKFDLKLATPVILEEFSSFTDDILRQYSGPEAQVLEHDYLEATQHWKRGGADEIGP